MTTSPLLRGHQGLVPYRGSPAAVGGAGEAADGGTTTVCNRAGSPRSLNRPFSNALTMSATDVRPSSKSTTTTPSRGITKLITPAVFLRMDPILARSPHVWQPAIWNCTVRFAAGAGAGIAPSHSSAAASARALIPA